MGKKSIIKEEDAREIRLQTALSFSRIAKACPNFNETLFGGEKNFKQRDFADISKNYITPNACFSLKKHTNGSMEVANVIASQRGAAYKLLTKELRDEKSYMAKIHERNINSQKLFKKLGFVSKKKQTEKGWITFIRSKQIMGQKVSVRKK